MKTRTVIAALVAMGSIAAQADLGYNPALVDGANANTFGVSAGSYYALPHVSGDNLWSERANSTWGADGLVVNSSGEDSPMLYTVIGGLTAGEQYYVDAIFVTGTDTDWPIRAGLATNSLTLFSRTGNVIDGNASTAGTLYYDNPGSKYDAYSGALGTATADASGEITVYVDDLPYTNDGTYRTWYDGVNVTVIPEPATLGLVGLFGAGALFVRRRFMI